MIRFIGDVHGRYDLYRSVLPRNGASVQVGDLGLDYSELRKRPIDPLRHKAIAGNHDCYRPDGEHFQNQLFFLGDYGSFRFPGEASFFYVRGAWSIDHATRLPGTNWWEEEQLSHAELQNAINAYVQAKPALVVTHEAPNEIVKFVTDPAFSRRFGHDHVVKTRTSMALQAMLEAHQPDHWVFGHYHKAWDETIGRTRFTCLDMLRNKGQTDGCTIDV